MSVLSSFSLASSFRRLLSSFARLKMTNAIGTHSGSFHCDEAFACFMLKQLPEFKDSSIVRTRDSSTLEKCDIVVDVGGVYDPSKKRYDHHQAGFEHTMKSLGILNYATKLSSAGLVYAHYGKEVIRRVLGEGVSDKMIDILYQRVYETFVEAIDAVDNGISQYDGTPKYHMSGGISARVGRLNPHWNEDGVDRDVRFKSAMDLVGLEFVETVRYLSDVWWPARMIVEQSVKQRFSVDKSGRIIALEKGGCPWKEHFFDIEVEQKLQDEMISFIIYQDTTANDWRVQAIPTGKNVAFQSRVLLPTPWRGYREEVLSELASIPDCIFVHATGFIGGNRTREGALQMARVALQFADCVGDKEKTTSESTKRAKLSTDGEHLESKENA